MQHTHCWPLHNTEVIGFASHMSIASQKALGTRVPLVHSPHSSLRASTTGLSHTETPSNEGAALETPDPTGLA